MASLPSAIAQRDVHFFEPDFKEAFLQPNNALGFYGTYTYDHFFSQYLKQHGTKKITHIVTEIKKGKPYDGGLDFTDVYYINNGYLDSIVSWNNDMPGDTRAQPFVYDKDRLQVGKFEVRSLGSCSQIDKRKIDSNTLSILYTKEHHVLKVKTKNSYMANDASYIYSANKELIEINSHSKTALTETNDTFRISANQDSVLQEILKDISKLVSKCNLLDTFNNHTALQQLMNPEIKVANMYTYRLPASTVAVFSAGKFTYKFESSIRSDVGDIFLQPKHMVILPRLMIQLIRLRSADLVVMRQKSICHSI